MPPDPNGPPADLDVTGKALYRKLREFLQGQSTWEDSDKQLLGQTCRYDQRARVARSKMVDQLGKLTLTATGFNGQLVQHPNLKTAEAAEKSFVEGLKELGLTPRARRQLGIEVGGGDADDTFGGVL